MDYHNTMDLLSCLEDQMSINFTGKINLTESDSGQLIGVFLLKEGRLINATYRNIIHQATAVAKAYIGEAEGSEKFKYVVEPEIINSENETYNFSNLQLKTYLAQELEKHIAAKKLKPKNDLKIYVNPQFILEGENNLSQVQIKLLKVINEYTKAHDIYQQAPYLDREVTDNLVKLRKMKVLKVKG